MLSPSKSVEIAQKISADLADREGFMQVWNALSPDTQFSILLDWSDIISEAFGK